MNCPTHGTRNTGIIVVDDSVLCISWPEIFIRDFGIPINIQRCRKAIGTYQCIFIELSDLFLNLNSMCGKLSYWVRKQMRYIFKERLVNKHVIRLTFVSIVCLHVVEEVYIEGGPLPGPKKLHHGCELCQSLRKNRFCSPFRNASDLFTYHIGR